MQQEREQWAKLWWKSTAGFFTPACQSSWQKVSFVAMNWKYIGSQTNQTTWNNSRNLKKSNWCHTQHTFQIKFPFIVSYSNPQITSCAHDIPLTKKRRKIQWKSFSPWWLVGQGNNWFLSWISLPEISDFKWGARMASRLNTRLLSL